MKRFLTLLIIVLPLFYSFKQANIQADTTRTWVYQNPEIVSDLAPYDAALAASDLDRYRYFDHRNIIHFENGLNVELMSANELTALGITYKANHIRTHEPQFNTGSVFKLAQNGHLVEVMTKIKVK
ncbi:MAG: hypothetical protein M0D57_11810 [Sphingobacteriales bacterium JAD_PAG50586_3]|nr:MAG: hypothetical protein M0D57_11810 [Sphingobacteriales bacterium JAD_PAG50586_3]